MSESSSVVADRGLLDELQKVGTNLSSSVSARPGADKALNSSGSGPQSFLDAVRNNTTVSNPESSAASGYSSVRTEDEEIRATRQQRMQQQGLDGSGNTGWRTGDGSDGSLSEATSFSELLANDSETQAGTDGKRNLSAEQFTLYVLGATASQSLRLRVDCLVTSVLLAVPRELHSRHCCTH